MQTSEAALYGEERCRNQSPVPERLSGVSRPQWARCDFGFPATSEPQRTESAEGISLCSRSSATRHRPGCGQRHLVLSGSKRNSIVSVISCSRFASVMDGKTQGARHKRPLRFYSAWWRRFVRFSRSHKTAFTIFGGLILAATFFVDNFLKEQLREEIASLTEARSQLAMRLSLFDIQWSQNSDSRRRFLADWRQNHPDYETLQSPGHIHTDLEVINFVFRYHSAKDEVDRLAKWEFRQANGLLETVRDDMRSTGDSADAAYDELPPKVHEIASYVKGGMVRISVYSKHGEDGLQKPGPNSFPNWVIGVVNNYARIEMNEDWMRSGIDQLREQIEVYSAIWSKEISTAQRRYGFTTLASTILYILGGFAAFAGRLAGDDD